MKRKIRMGMVGGGRGAFIGVVHRMAAQMDVLIELACGAFSSSAEKSVASGRDLMLPADRCYASYQQMFESEKALPSASRMDFVSIVTPNHMHFPVAKAALEHGFHVMCDKPLTATLEEAVELEKLVEQSGLLFGLTHNYTGYPMIKQARHLVRSGQLGSIRKAVAEYPQGWLASALEQEGQKQANWRTDPKQAGASCCMGDIGSHAENLLEYVTGLKIERLSADLATFVAGRPLDDDGSVLLRLEGGARGLIWASQVCIGVENGLSLRVYGQKGGLEWRQEEPNSLLLRWPHKPPELLRSGANFQHLSPVTLFNSRLPSGHPEGFIEAFANLYRCFAHTLDSRLQGKDPKPEYLDFPTVSDGVRGMRFIDAVVRSNTEDRKWTEMGGEGIRNQESGVRSQEEIGGKHLGSGIPSPSS